MTYEHHHLIRSHVLRSSSVLMTDILEGADVTEKELAVEKEIRNMIVSWREDEGLSTMFDEQLSIILQVTCRDVL